MYFDPNPLVCFSNSPTLGKGFVLGTSHERVLDLAIVE
jgi:hypothetical protein